MTTAASGVAVTEAGAPGFEPGIAGPKPAALPLGYAPLVGDSLGTLGEEEDQSGDGDQGDHGDRDRLQEPESDRHAEDEQL